MGLVVLHSGHFSKIFKKLMGTTCDLKWREEKNDREVLWVTRPGHPIVQAIDDHFILDTRGNVRRILRHPRAGETFLISSFAGGEVFRSRLHLDARRGRIVYFRPGHETYPTYHDKNVCSHRERRPLGRPDREPAAAHVWESTGRVVGGEREIRSASRGFGKINAFPRGRAI